MSPAARPRVVVGMSGGVDSSVAAALLKDQGFDVIGVMLRLWSDAGVQNRCCAPQAQLEARQIAGQLEIPFYVLDAQERFYSEVVVPFIDGYAQGITPNPCLNCNRTIRWGFLQERARVLGADLIATGHYARIDQDRSGAFRLLRNPDPDKDQSYFLHVLTQADLSRTLFPLGEYTKPQVRELAAAYGLQVASRPDSQDLCFVGQADYRDFLRKANPSLSRPGPIVDHEGRSRGQHTGLADYTIGQRKGIKISGPEPYYVIHKDPGRNLLVIGPRDSLGKAGFQVGAINWISGHAPSGPLTAAIKIRYQSRPVIGSIQVTDQARAEVTLDEPLPDVTPGQAAVFYQDQVCLGGGTILQEAA